MTESPPLLDRDCDTNSEIRISEVIAALSYALDLAEGQPEGHALRTCFIGMRIAHELKLGSADRAALFYALLLKDVGGTATSAKICCLFGADDHAVKCNLKSADWRTMSKTVQFVSRNVMPEGSAWQRALRTAVVALEGPSGPSRIFRIRSQRGARIARQLGLAEATANGIRHLDERWDGRGHPAGLRGEEISLIGRIAGLAQMIDIFFTTGGQSAAIGLAAERGGAWFDPALVDAFLSLAGDTEFWSRLESPDLDKDVPSLEPADLGLNGNQAALDRIARAFAEIIDAKSPWTYRHSEGVARIAVGIANVLGLPDAAVARVYRAGLLHDVGKLAASNLILDKPGHLTSEQYGELRQHTEHTLTILGRSEALADIAELAATHHERLDGRGYHRGIRAGELPIEARLLAVADISEALAARRPYRDAMPRERVEEVLTKEAGTAVCPDCVAALKKYHERSDILSRVNGQLNELERVLAWNDE
jgi:putative nucleotidyltransferase with HDIG domain